MLLGGRNRKESRVWRVGLGRLRPQKKFQTQSLLYRKATAPRYARQLETSWRSRF